MGATRSARPPALATLLAVLVTLACLVPLAYVIQSALDAGWSTAYELVFRARVGQLLGNTVKLVVTAVPATVVLGVAAALLVERTALRGRGVLALLFAAPLAVPAFVASYAWATIWPSIGGLGGALLVSVASYFPFVYIPVMATLRRLDPAVEESARSLGLGPAAVLVRVVLPQLRLPVLGGALLVGVHLLAEYGAFAFVRYDTFTTAIYDQYRSTFASTAAAMLAGVLLLCCLLLLTAEAGVRGRERYARVGPGAARRPRLAPLGGWSVPCWAGALVVLVLSLGVPGWSIGRWLVSGGAAVWSGELLSILGTTLLYGVLAGLITCAAGLPIAWLSVRHPGRWVRALEGATFIAASLPGIVVGLAVVSYAIRYAQVVYQTPILLIGAYAVLFLPRAVVTLRAGIAQAPPALEEAARSLGTSHAMAFVRVTLPLLAPALGGAIALTFLGVTGELTATLLLAPTGTTTLATQFWSLTSEIDYAAAAPYAFLLVVLSLPMTYLLFQQSRKVAGLS